MNLNEHFRQRTKVLAIQIIQLYRNLPKTDDARIIGKQLLRSATLVAANYRAVGRARSEAEKFAKLSIVVEEADESLFWLELLTESQISKAKEVSEVQTELTEIVKTMSSYRAKLKNNKFK